MNRRDLVLGIGVAPLLIGCQALRPSVQSIRSGLIKPPVLEPGQTVGLIAPSGFVIGSAIGRYIQNIESLGLKVKLAKNLTARWGGYGGTIQERVADLHEMFQDKNIHAIWAARGGSGASALLPSLDFDLIRAHPKALVGYSDVTALHLALHFRAGLVSFHGPVAGSVFSDFTTRNLKAVLMQPQKKIELPMAQEHRQMAVEQTHFERRVINPGICEGELWGGNLSLVASLLGTSFTDSVKDKILFLEDVGEAPYRIDRMMTQLHQATPVGLASAAGIMLGVFSRIKPLDDDPSLTLGEVFDHHLKSTRRPSGYGYSFGHIPHQWTLPIGVRARLDTASETLTLLEQGVAD